MKRITVYTPTELKRKNPQAFEKAHSQYNYDDTEIPWQGEIMDSLKAIFKASGINLRDCEISGFSYSWLKFDMESDTESLSGPRAMAWLESNLFSDLRERRTFLNRVKKYDKWHDFTKYGEIPCCPFTGYCADDDFIESLINDIKDGETLGDAYHNLAQVAGKMFESEIEYVNSDEYFLEQEHLQYTIDGRMV